MKKISLLVSTIALWCIALLLFSFHSQTPKPTSVLLEQYRKNSQSFLSSIKDLSQKIQLISTKKYTQSQLQDDFRTVRINYKSIELFAEYLEPDFIKDFVNGPPLQHLERNFAQLSELEPEGLQAIEELVYADDLMTNNETLESLQQKVNKLLIKVDELVQFQKNSKLTDRNIFEAMQLELIRIMTLSIIGFDTPASPNCLLETSVSMQSIENAISLYYEELGKKNPKLQLQIKTLLQQSIAQLKKQKNPDTFDRVKFLREFADPLYASIIDAQEQLNIEFIYETDPSKHSINYKVRSIFSKDFLNKYFYTALTEKENSKEKERLGELLFFDPILSHSNERACASCHKPELAFTDGLPKSTAMNFEGTVQRNSPTLINAVYSDRYFYDLRADVLESQLEHVVISEKEFNTTFEEIIEKISSIEEYKRLFNSAYKSNENEPITKSRIQEVLSSYVASLTSFNSEFDTYMRKERSALSPAAYRGANLFLGKAGCATCHFLPMFNGSVPPLFREMESEVLGVPLNNTGKNFVIDPDLGRYVGQLKERSSIYKHSFKTVTVRNVKSTAPYMHNGVYKTLEEVMDFYNNGGGAGLGISVENQTLPSDSLGLTKQEIKDLIAFMHSLSDNTTLNKKPKVLPNHSDKLHQLNARVIGGKY
jgi:cytochrome c peroxidase